LKSIEKSIISRIQGKGRGSCFTPKAFLDIGSAEAVRIALHRLEKHGFVRRLARGLYDFPIQYASSAFFPQVPRKSRGHFQSATLRDCSLLAHSQRTLLVYVPNPFFVRFSLMGELCTEYGEQTLVHTTAIDQ
jgi:hypothetical protein